MGGLSREQALWLSQNVLPHEPALRAWLNTRRVTGLDVDDVVQEAYARLAALASFDQIKNPKNYFFQTAYSVLVTHLRRSRVISIEVIDDVERLNFANDEPSPECRVSDREQLRRVAEAIAGMPDSCRKVFTLRRIEGLSQREVARRLALSENTVEHHMTHGLRILMDLFGRGGKRRSSSSILQDGKASVENEQTRN